MADGLWSLLGCLGSLLLSLFEGQYIYIYIYIHTYIYMWYIISSQSKESFVGPLVQNSDVIPFGMNQQKSA